MLLLLGCLLLAVPASLHAQMFSVESEEERNDDRNIAIYAGIGAADFEYKGDPSAANSGRFAFSGPLLNLRFATPGLNIFLSSGGAVTGLDDISYFNVGLRTGINLPLYRKEKIRISLPLQLSPSFTSVTNSNVVLNSSQFQQTSLTGAGGLAVSLKPSENLQISLDAVPAYGFSFASGGTFGGNLAKFHGGVRLFIDSLFKRFGLSVGYDFDVKSFDIDQEQFDYDLRSHSFLVGITF